MKPLVQVALCIFQRACLNSCGDAVLLCGFKNVGDGCDMLGIVVVTARMQAQGVGQIARSNIDRINARR